MGGPSPPPRAIRSRPWTLGRWRWPSPTGSCGPRCSASSTSFRPAAAVDDLARHLVSFLDEVPATPPPLSAALRISGSRAGRAALGAAAAGGVRHLADRFIVGESPRAALSAFRGLWDDGAASSVDLLGEATVTEGEADRDAARCADALDVLALATARWPARPQLEADDAGLLPRANVCVKTSGLTPLLRPDAPDRGQRDAAQRLRPLLRRARDAGAHLHIDMDRWTPVRPCWNSCSICWTRKNSARARPPASSAGLPAHSLLTLDQVLAWAQPARARPP